MKVGSKVALLAALMLPAATVPAAAQTWKWDVNVNAGYSWFNEMISAENSGLASATEDDVKFKNGGLLGAQLTFWPSSRIGLRLNGTYADRPLTSKDYNLTSPANSGISAVNLWSASGDLLFRFVKPRSEYSGLEFLPYLALGLGAKWHNPAGDNYTCNDVEEGESFACAPFTIGSGANTGASFALAEANSLMGLVGLGADWRLSRGFAIRTEVGDRIWDARLHQITPPIAANMTLTQGDTDFGEDVHEIYAQAGLTFLFGVERAPVVAVVPAPAPAPVTPAPAPTVRRDNISVCVIDPTAPGGIRMQSAVLVENRDTVVVVNGTDRPFSTSVGTVSVASNADWYVRGQPLTITVGTDKIEYATYGSARIVEASDLAYLGTVNGMPVYADRDEVADVIDELNELNRARAGTDLGKILDENRELRNDLADVKVLYVPMAASGCTFQAVQLQEKVQKGK